MESITRILTAIVPLLGIASGLIIARYTKKEIREGRKYLNDLCNVLLALVVVIIVAKHSLKWAIIEGLIIYLLLLFIRMEHKYKIIPLLGISSVLNPATAIIAFLYNMTIASIQYKNKKKLAIAGALYLGIALVAAFTI